MAQTYRYHWRESTYANEARHYRKESWAGWLWRQLRLLTGRIGTLVTIYLFAWLCLRQQPLKLVDPKIEWALVRGASWVSERPVASAVAWIADLEQRAADCALVEQSGRRLQPGDKYSGCRARIASDREFAGSILAGLKWIENACWNGALAYCFKASYSPGWCAHRTWRSGRAVDMFEWLGFDLLQRLIQQYVGS